MTYGIILAAGKQTRFTNDKPKALANVTMGISLLELNIEVMSRYVDQIIVICAQEFFNEFMSVTGNRALIVPITAGGGCGFATLKALEEINPQYEEKVFLIWGDSIQLNLPLYETCLDHYNGRFLMPVELQESPYVSIIADENGIIEDVKYSKFDGPQKNGWHDFSLFLFHGWLIKKQLYNLIDRNGEKLFLDLFVQKSTRQTILGEIFPVKGFNSNNSFNTLEELQKIKEQFVAGDF